MKSLETLKELHQLTEAMVALSLCNEQNFPTTEGSANGEFEITVNNATRMTIALKNIAYDQIYTEMELAKCFNLKMLDGALVSLRYRFWKGDVCEHTLSYFPSPELEHFQNDPEVYLQDEVYAEIIVPFPIRFDYSNDSGKFIVRTLESNQLPRSHDIDFDAGWQNDPMTSEQLKTIASRWRYQQR